MRYVYVCFIASLVVAQPLIAASDNSQSRDYRPPRLEDGRADLQGVWGHTNLTPFERPADLSSFIITPEQAAAIKAKIDSRNDDLTRPAEPALYFDDRTVERIRGQLRSSIVIDPATGSIPGNDFYKQKIGQARTSVLTAFDGPEQRIPSERCLGAPSATPPIQLVPASDLRRIVQTPNAIVFMTEELHEARVVRMNATHVPPAIVSWLGDSIGWWEGDTLVIETTSFAPTSELRASPNSMFLVSPKTVVTERITRVADDELS
jgi:hypothetical protein